MGARPKKKKKEKLLAQIRKCEDCGADISEEHHFAKYCDKCRTLRRTKQRDNKPEYPVPSSGTTPIRDDLPADDFSDIMEFDKKEKQFETEIQKMAKEEITPEEAPDILEKIRRIETENKELKGTLTDMQETMTLMKAKLAKEGISREYSQMIDIAVDLLGLEDRKEEIYAGGPEDITKREDFMNSILGRFNTLMSDLQKKKIALDTVLAEGGMEYYQEMKKTIDEIILKKGAPSTLRDYMRARDLWDRTTDAQLNIGDIALAMNAILLYIAFRTVSPQIYEEFRRISIEKESQMTGALPA